MGEAQYRSQIDEFSRRGPPEMGPMSGAAWRADPRRFIFFLARYKFVAKMLEGKKSAVEFGCGDGFGMRVVNQAVNIVHGIDFDHTFIDWATYCAAREGLSCTFECLDFLKQSPGRCFDAAYSLDVIEHIPESLESRYVDNMADALSSNGVCIVGTPNITATQYASPLSLEGHINLKSAEDLRLSMSRRFANIFMFSMNDEVVHTGFAPMAHYLFAMCVGKV